MRNNNIFKLVVLGILVIGIGIISLWAIQPTKAPKWTGFGPYDEQIEGPRSKTLWDWFELLIIPAFLAGAALTFDQSQKRHEQNLETDRQRQNALDTYFSCMTELLTNNQLRDTENQEIRSIARTRTLAILRILDNDRKVQVLQFLYEAGMINKNPVIKLNGANFQSINLDNATLSGAELRGVYFNNVSLKDANLRDCILCGSDLSGGNLSGSDFSNANLRMSVFKKSNLTGVDFSNANMEWVDLFAANLKTAKLINEQLIRISSLEKAILPNGKRYKSNKQV